MTNINCGCGQNTWEPFGDGKISKCCGMVFKSFKENTDENDVVNNPKHYNSHPSGIECIEVVRWFSFNIGNAIKYLWRAGLKGDAIEDLQKAKWYIDDEIERRKKELN